MLVVVLFGGLFAIWYVMKCRYENYLESDPIVVHLKTKLIPVFPQFKSVKVLKGTSSYTIDKSKIYLCTEHNGTTYDENLLTYVLLHELAHTINEQVGHGIEFQSIFGRLLIVAERNGLYDPSKPRIENYCKS